MTRKTRAGSPCHGRKSAMSMRISIVGTGYVGLVTGVCLAAKGHDVTCVDIDRGKVDAINRGVPPIHEAGLEELLKKHAGSNLDRKSTRLNSSHANISYAVFCLKKKKS